MAVIRGFESLTGGYLGQDWADEYPTADRALVDFVRDEDVDDVTASIAGFDKLISAECSEKQYYDRWIYDLHSGYDPRRDGLTFREWFSHARDVLAAELAKRAD